MTMEAAAAAVVDDVSSLRHWPDDNRFLQHAVIVPLNARGYIFRCRMQHHICRQPFY